MRTTMMMVALASLVSACGNEALVGACDDVADDADALASCLDGNFAMLRQSLDACADGPLADEALDGLEGVEGMGPDGPPPCEVGPDGRPPREDVAEGEDAGQAPPPPGDGTRPEPPEGADADRPQPPGGDEGTRPERPEGEEAGRPHHRPGVCRPPLRHVCAELPEDAPDRLVEACERFEARHGEMDAIRERTHERVRGADGTEGRRGEAREGMGEAVDAASCEGMTDA